MVISVFISMFEVAGAAPLPGDSLKLLRDGVSVRTLSNGLRIIFYRRGDAPVFSGVVAVRVGGSDEKPGQTGISHMFEHMAFKGTVKLGTKSPERERVLLNELEEIASESSGAQTMNEEQKKRWDQIHRELTTLWIPEAFSREMEQHGAAGLNASTSSELTQYYVSLPRDAFEFWCRMEADRLLNPVLRQFYQERDVVQEEQRTRSEDDPMGKLLQNFYATAFLIHPYRQPVIGYVHDIRGLTAAKLEEFRRKYYVPGNMVLSLVGDVHPDRDIKVLERYFGVIEPGQMPTRPEIREPDQEGPRNFTLYLNSSPELLIGYRKPIYPDPDDARISIMLEMLTGGRTSPMYRELVQKRRLATSVGSDEGPGQGYPNLAVFFMEPRSPHTNAELLKAFDDVLQSFKTGPVQGADLEMARRKIAVGYLHAMQSSSSLASLLASSELMYGSWFALLDWYDQAVNVTLEDVQKAARTFLVPEKRTIGMIEKKEKIGEGK